MEHEISISADWFLKYQFAEAKDLLKTFITLISGTLVFSIAFAEKIVNFQNSNKISRLSLLSCWILLIVALVFSGLSIYSLALAGGAAMYGNPKSVSAVVFVWAYRANLLGLLAGMSFVVALILMIAAAVWSSKPAR